MNSCMFRKPQKHVFANKTWIPPYMNSNFCNGLKKSFKTKTILNKTKNELLTAELCSIADGINPLSIELQAYMKYKIESILVNPATTSIKEKSSQYFETELDQNNHNQSILHLASRYNLGADVSSYLAEKFCVYDKVHKEFVPSLCFLDNQGYSPLAEAASANAVETFQALLNAEKEFENRYKQLMARQESKDSKKLLNKFNRRVTPLISALKSGSMDCARLLLDEVCVLRREFDDIGRTAIHWAAVLDYPDILERLLRTKRVQKLITLQDDYGLTALDLAQREGNFECIKILLATRITQVEEFSDSESIT